MIGLDTNIIVRMIVADDAEQNAKIQNFFATYEGNCFVSVPSIQEAYWVVSKVYKLEKNLIIQKFLLLFEIKNFVIENEQLLRDVLEIYRQTNHDLVDILIGTINKLYGCTKTMTFDKEAAKLSAFDLL